MTPSENEHFPRLRALFYSHDGTGLGHLRRTLAIADEFARRRPDAAVLVVASAQSCPAPEPAPGIDVVKLPSIACRPLYFGLGDDAALPDVFSVRAALLEATARAFAPHVVLVDHEPVGLAGELRPALAALAAASPRPRLVFGMRDITYAPARTRRLWTRFGAFDLLESTYDRVLIYGDRSVFDPITAYGLSDAVAGKAAFVGYVGQPDGPPTSADARARFGVGNATLVVVTTGGGANGATLIDAYLDALADGRLRDVASVVVGGPQLPPAEASRLERRAAALPRVTFVRSLPELPGLVRAADAVVCMGGYNSVFEAIAAGKRPIVVPLAGATGEQEMRAARLAEIGLATVVPEPALTGGQLAEAVADELTRGVSLVHGLDFDGRRRTVDALLTLIDEAFRADGARREWRRMETTA
jgi:predicted glycosyltransferase